MYFLNRVVKIPHLLFYEEMSETVCKITKLDLPVLEQCL